MTIVSQDAVAVVEKSTVAPAQGMDHAAGAELAEHLGDQRLGEPLLLGQLGKGHLPALARQTHRQPHPLFFELGELHGILMQQIPGLRKKVDKS